MSFSITLVRLCVTLKVSDGVGVILFIIQKLFRVVFVSGHFNNFELMAMQLENSGLNIAAIYRPLNNVFLNRIMEKIRFNDICKKQIKTFVVLKMQRIFACAIKQRFGSSVG